MDVRERTGPTPVHTRPHRPGPTWARQHATRLAVLDAAAATTAGLVAYAIRFGADGDRYLLASLTLPAAWVLTMGMTQAYEPKTLGIGSEEFQRVFRGFVGLTAAIGFASFATKAELARGYILVALPLLVVLTLLGRYAARKRLHRHRRAGASLHRVIAVGTEQSVVDLTERLAHEPHSGLAVVGTCLVAGDGAAVVGLGVPLLGGPDDVVAAVRAAGADTVAVTASEHLEPVRLRRLAWELEGTDTQLVVAPGLLEVAGPRLHIRPVPGLPLLHVEEPEFGGSRRLLKGAVDRLVAFAALVLLLPLLAVIALAVRLTSPGPVLFRQTRVGRDGREFTMVKFRSMYADAEARRAELAARNDRSEGVLFKIRDDPRVTPVGRRLRAFSLDELPQLLNVLTGSMSLVGPRPPLPAEVALYDPDARRRLLVKPGLTGLWQVSGRSDLTWEESVRLDLRYVENWSLTLDLMILWKTTGAVLRGSGAY